MGYWETQFLGIIKIDTGARIIVDDFSIHYGSHINIGSQAELILKSGFISYNCEVSCMNKIEIGEGVAIAANVTLRDNDGHSLTGSVSTAPIIIGNHVWIGTGAIIIKRSMHRRWGCNSSWCCSD